MSNPCLVKTSSEVETDSMVVNSNLGSITSNMKENNNDEIFFRSEDGVRKYTTLPPSRNEEVNKITEFAAESQ